MRLTILSVGLVACVAGCDDGTAATAVDYAPLLTSLTETVALPATTTLATDADALVGAMTALESSVDDTTLAAAQAAWRTVRADYRHLDALYFGPVSDLGIDSRIDASPASHPSIDAIVQATTTIDDATVSNAGGTTKGFLGVEYLMFSASGMQAALSNMQGDGAPLRRRTLSKAMADEIAMSAHQLADGWRKQKGAFATLVETAGAGSSRYATQRGAMDDYVNASAYALEYVVGTRLALPLGRQNNGVPDASLDPTPASDSAVADMLASLDGVKAMWDAGYGASVTAASADLATKAATQMADCRAKVAAVPLPFATAITSSEGVVQAAYQSCKVWKDTWNTEITSALGATVQIPDTDGD